ncbi:hypothetical protein MLD38_002978 [Melastoma candidum]|uniref:Uncharacterized protein n=1 Tax=Melastoma candidum TaxID=119954 RepID=A0ACB9S5J6_9MYRT|nr:hypothetical protein MLD38_002978 [Melastoma candidum]
MANCHPSLALARRSAMDGGNPDSTRTETDGREGVEGVAAAAGQEVKVSLFDSSVESHVRTMEAIAKICGREESEVSLEDREVIRLSSAITFLREWRYFKYEPRVIKFVDSSRSYGKTSPTIEVTLPQFSAAAVPKDTSVFDEAASSDSSKDYVIHVGGPIWSLDWCPRDSGGSECQFKEEFIAVSAHPSGSSYHKLGSPLTGRGAIQIWCLVTVKEGEMTSVDNRGRKRQTSQALKDHLTKPKRPRGRPRKKPVEKPLDSLDALGEFVEALDIQLPQGTIQSASPNWTSDDAMPIAALRDLCRKKRKSKRVKGTNVKLLETCIGRSCDSEFQEERSLSVRTDDDGLSVPNQQKHCSVTPQPAATSDAYDSLPLCIGTGYELPMDVAIPRLVFCLAHNGKVAWDTKWRPAMNLKQCQHQMGYLAVLLGNGSLEV